MTVRIMVWRDTPTEPDAMVLADGNTIAHAVRRAAHCLRLGVGRTRSVRPDSEPDQWIYDWSGVLLRVRKIERSDEVWEPLVLVKSTSPLPRSLPRVIDLLSLSTVSLRLSAAAVDELARGAAEHGGSRDDYIELLLRRAAAQRNRVSRDDNLALHG
jgi:hypothetical protein